MIVVGISAFYHDSAAALIRDGEIVAAAQEERFTRRKHDAGFPVNALEFCLKQAGISADQVDRVAFYDKPLLKFERLMETYLAFAPRGFIHVIKPAQIGAEDFLKGALHTHTAEMQNGAATVRLAEQRHAIIQIRLDEARGWRQHIRKGCDIRQAQCPAKRAKALREVAPQRAGSAGQQYRF